MSKRGSRTLPSVIISPFKFPLIHIYTRFLCGVPLLVSPSETLGFSYAAGACVIVVGARVASLTLFTIALNQNYTHFVSVEG